MILELLRCYLKFTAIDPAMMILMPSGINDTLCNQDTSDLM